MCNKKFMARNCYVLDPSDYAPRFSLCLTLLGRGAESARTFFRWLFLHEKGGLEVPNFVTFPNSLWTFRKAKKNFWFFTVFWGNLKGAGWSSPPHWSNIQKPFPIRVNHWISSFLNEWDNIYFSDELSNYFLINEFIN